MALPSAAIVEAVESLRGEIVQRLVDLVNIGSLLDTPEENEVQASIS